MIGSILRHAAIGILLLATSAALPAWARPHGAAAIELPLDATYETSSEPLTTEKVWSLDPEELNPHRQRWVLSRRVDLKDVEPVALKNGVYGVQAAKIASHTVSYIRPSGPWFRAMSEFPCTSEPEAWFGTQEGARRNADSAAAEWDRILGAQRTKLALELDQVRGESAELALKKAELLFHNWLREVESEWRGPGRQKARLEEWRYYVREAAALGLCKGEGVRKHAKVERDEYVPPTPTWDKMMEPPSTEGTSAEFKNLLARAPARRWDGLFSVRLTVLVGTRELVGQFLLDTGAAMSVISPDFLDAQGILPAWVEVPGAPLQRVTWSGGSGLARRASVDGTSLGGYNLPLHDFLLFDTGFFDIPDNVAPCCDGILGNDLLRKFAVEFRPGPPAEVLLWPREGFHLAQGTPWVEVALTAAGEPVSACDARPETDGMLALPGVRWDTGSEMPLDIHVPWQREARKHGEYWKLACGPLTVAREVPVTFPKPASGEEGSSTPFTARIPAVNAGIPLLARGDVFFDLPHGRIWFTEENLKGGFPQNRTGLGVKYVLGKGGDRELRVTSIRKGSSAQALARAGLTVGALITQLDGKPAGDLDDWEVDRHLAGVYGKTVTIQWKSRKGLRLATLQL